MKLSTQSSNRPLSSIARIASVGAIFGIMASQSASAIVSYYIGVDGRTTIPSGAYAGLPNPNFNNLTFLYAHTYAATPDINHYHSKGTIVYTGPNLGAGTATMVSTSNYLPEGAAPPLLLQAGVGAYADKLVNIPDPMNPFSMLDIADTGALDGFAALTPEHYLFNSSGGRWTPALTNADVHMKLVSATAGLFFGTDADPLVNPFADPEGLHLTDEFSFSLFPWVNDTAAPGFYTATFELEDEEGLFGGSGTFEFRFQVIPEPSGVALVTLAGAVLAVRRRRNS